MRRVLPDPAPITDIHAEYEVSEPMLRERGWHLRMNFVSSADGAVTVDGVSAGLSPPADRAVFAALRDLADVILVGAGTVRTEGYRPARPSEQRRAGRRARGQSDTPAIAVVSGRLALDPNADLFTASDARTVVLTHASAPRERRESLAAVTDVVVAGAEAVDLPAALAELARRGMRRILCEGGPHLFTALLGARAIDELCLTLSPLLTGPGAGRIVAGEPVTGAELGLTRMLEADGALFLTYQVPR